MDAAKNNHNEEEGAPKLQQEHFAEGVIRQTTSHLVIRAQESRSTQTQMSVDDTKVGSNDL